MNHQHFSDQDEVPPGSERFSDTHDFTGCTGVAVTDLAAFGRIEVQGVILEAMASGKFLRKGQSIYVVQRYMRYWKVRPINPV